MKCPDVADSPRMMELNRSIDAPTRYVERVIRDLARTPGAMLVRLTARADDPAGRAARAAAAFSAVYAADDLPADLRIPNRRGEILITLIGAIRPKRPVRGGAELLDELNHARRGQGQTALAGEAAVTDIGTDDFGFLTYEIQLHAPVGSM